MNKNVKELEDSKKVVQDIEKNDETISEQIDDLKIEQTNNAIQNNYKNAQFNNKKKDIQNQREQGKVLKDQA